MARQPTSGTAVKRREYRSRESLLTPQGGPVAEAPPGTNWIQGVPAGCTLPFYQLRLDQEAVTKLQRFPRANDTYPGVFVAEGKVFKNVKVRDRGDWARTWPKKSLKIFFEPDQPFGDRHCLNLNSGWHDPAFVREPLACHLYAACGVPVPRSRMVRLHLNGQFRGLYVEVEQPDKAFLRRFGWQGASLFKAISKSNQSDERDLGDEAAYALHYEKENRKSEGHTALAQFCRELARATNTMEFFSGNVDLDRYISYLAATVLMQNWDCYNRNHYLVFDERGSKKWMVVPWDLDRTFGDFSRFGFEETRLPIFHGTEQTPGRTGWNRLADRLLSEPTLRARFLDRLAELLEKEFTSEKLFPVLDRFEADIRNEAAMDRRMWGGEGGDIHLAIAQVKNYIRERRAFLLEELASLRRSQVPAPK